MANSSRSALLKKWRKWKAENPDFPLSVGANGQWRKKIKGKTHHFGPLEFREEALAVWEADKPYLLAGKTPPNRDGFQVKDLCQKFKGDTTTRRESQEISATYARDLLHAADFLAEHLGPHVVESLSPGHFSELRQAVAGTGRSLRSQKNLIQQIRSVFLWGAEMKHHKAVEFGPRFRPPSSDALDRERETSGKSRFIDREDILAMLDEAKPAMKCMILLGINCGFYAQDSIHLTFDRLHLSHDIPHHDFPRVKNGRARVGVLWPETVAAIDSYIQGKRGGSDSDRVILNQYGRPYSKDAVGRGIRIAFQNLADKAKVILPAGTSIGSLRHTYGTILDLSGDEQMNDLSMGHAKKGVRKRIYSQLNLGELDRLSAVADVVRRWLYKNELAGVPGRDRATLRVVG